MAAGVDVNASDRFNAAIKEMNEVLLPAFTKAVR
jgi:hypothetical protein